MTAESPDLSLLTTAELIEELKRRSRSLVVGLDPLADRATYTVIRSGNKLGCAGMLRALTLDSDYDLRNDPRDRTVET